MCPRSCCLLANAGLPHERACEETCCITGYASRRRMLCSFKRRRWHPAANLLGCIESPTTCMASRPRVMSRTAVCQRFYMTALVRVNCRRTLVIARPSQGSAPIPCCSILQTILPQSTFRYSHHFTEAASIPQFFRQFLYYNLAIAASKRLHLGLASANRLKRNCYLATAPRECGQKQAPTHVCPYTPGLRVHPARL